MSRKDELIGRLTELASDLSGSPASDLPPTVPFLSLGFDSLFLTQLAAAYQKEFKAKITFRQLIDTTPTIAALGDHLDKTLPPSAVQPPANAPVAMPAPQAANTPQMPSVPMAPVSNANAEGLAGIFQTQLMLMQEQLRMLTGQPVAMPVTEVSMPEAQTVATEQPAEVTAEVEPPKPAMPKGFGPNLQEMDEIISASQQAHINRLMKRYNAKTKGSKARTQADRKHHADPRTASGFNSIWKEIVYPIHVERSLGARLWDVDGNEYIDMLNGFGPNFFGHRAPFITEALKAQLEDGYEVGPQTPLAGEAAKLLCELTGMDRVSWVNTGSEAVQAVMRISRTVTGRDKIVVFSGDYHGNFDEVLVRGVGNGPAKKTIPLAPGIPFNSVENVIVCDYGEDSALDRIAAEADDIAAVLVEPIQSRRPEFQPREFLHKLRDLTKDKGIVLVFDEVITGFRTCPGGAQEYYGVKADLATYGKIIGGGMPIGVVAGRKEFMDTFDGGMWQYGDDSKPTAGVTFFAGTFVRHPMTIAAVHASLKYLKSAGPQLQEGVNRKAKRMADELNAFFESRGVKIFVAQFASQMFFRVSEESELATLFFYHMRDRGVHILEGFPSYMTAAHTDEDVDAVIAAVKDSVLEMQADGLLPLRDGVEMVDYPRPFALTPGQQEMWVTAQLSDEANCAFNESDRLQIDGPLDTDRFIAAAEASLNAQEALRLSITPDGTEQILNPDARIELQQLDYSAFDELEQEAALGQLTGQEARTPFDLEQGPLARAYLIRLGAQRHIFLIYAHHIAFDGYSADLLIQDIAARYEGKVASSPQPYSAYVAAVAIRDPDAALEYWLATLREETPGALELPTDRPFPSIPHFAGATATRQLSADLPSLVKEAAKRHGVSANSFLLAAYALLLARLTGQENMIVGVPVAGQAAHGVDAVGYGVEMMPLRLKPDGQKTLGMFLTEVRDAVLAGSEHSAPSLIELIRELNVSRDAGRPTLIQAVFNNSGFLNDVNLGECRVSPQENPRQAVFYELFMNLTETDQGYVIDWDYSTAILDSETMDRWINLFEHLLRDLARGEDKPLAEYDWMSPEALKALYDCINNQVNDAYLTQSVSERIGKQDKAKRAMTMNGKSWSYGDVAEAVDRIATGLQAREIGKGDVVGVLMERSPEVALTMLAIWRCGAVYLPLDPQYPPARIGHMIQDSGARLVVAMDDEAEVDCPMATLVSLSESSGGQRLENARSDLAYMIYTSGSTGLPKGVKVSHGALWAYLNAVIDRIGLSKDDRFLSVTTPSFDISLLEMLGPLIVGGTVIFADADTVAEGEELGSLIANCDATMIQATPSLWRLLIDSGWGGHHGLTALSGGEPLPPSLAADLLSRTKALWNEYGPTETTVFSTYKHVTSAEDITAGTPLPNVQAYVVNRHHKLCPAAIQGEIWIGGDVVAEGYHNREALTAERFLPDPFGKPERRVYRTGDMGYLRPDGELVVLGRKDAQVKLRGFRVELGEIEAALTALDVVSAAAAVIREDAGGEPMLVAYTVYRDGEEATSSELRRALRKTLPNYMLPQMFVELDQMPMTDNGKIDRNALPQPSGAANDHAVKVAPRDDMEQALADVWADMLSVEKISITDNFFELGGQSLQAAQMVVRVRKLTGKKIAPRAVIFETLEQLAAGAEAV